MDVLLAAYPPVLWLSPDMIRIFHPLRIALLVAVVLASMAGVNLRRSYQTQPILVLGPMVQNVTCNGFAVFCSTHNADPVTSRLYADGERHAAGTVSPRGEAGFMIAFDGLQPARTYQYEILSAAGESLARHSVRTAPADDRPFRFVALGDTGVGDRHQNRVARHMRTYRPDLIVHTGDLVYPRGILEEHHRKFFQPYAELLPEVPLYACMGNHECRMPGVERVPVSFILPSNGPPDVPTGRNYWFDYGRTRFIAIDSNNDEWFFADVIVPWLDDVMASAKDADWKILFFHEPVHTQAKYPPAVKLLRTIVPVLESHSADLVLCGHNHLFERSHPVKDGRIVSPAKGTVYVTTGAGGANLATARLPMPETIATWNDNVHSFTVADVTRDVLRLRQISESGQLLDEYHIERDR